MGNTAEVLENRVAALNTLPTLPGVVQKISRLAEDRTSSAADVAAALSADQVLCSKVLRMVNSPVYGFPGRISTVKHALVLLGFNVVKGLVLGSAIFGSLGKENAKGMWEHSLGCAVLSRRLAREAGLAEAEEIMIAGLLHDLGKVIMGHVMPAEYAKALELAVDRKCHIAEAERQILGVDHTRVGGWLAHQWCFPARLSEPLQYHHTPELAQTGADVTAVVHLADILARSLAYGYPGDRSMPALDRRTLDTLGLSFKNIETVMDDAESEYAAGAALLELGD